MPIPVISTPITDKKINEIWYRYFFDAKTLFDTLSAAFTTLSTAVTPVQGLWTPTYVTDGVAFTSVTYNAVTGGRYLKIGNLVHIQATLATDAVTKGAAAGNIAIAGFPYLAVASTGSTEDALASFAVSSVVSWLTTAPSACRITGGSALAFLFGRTAVDGSTVNTVVADVGTGAVNNVIRIAGTYITG